MAKKTEGEIQRARLQIWLDGSRIEPVSKSERGLTDALSREAIEAAMRQSIGPVEPEHQPLNVRQG